MRRALAVAGWAMFGAVVLAAAGLMLVLTLTGNVG